jgi:phage terminase large subunit GpA-like protein
MADKTRSGDEHALMIREDPSLSLRSLLTQIAEQRLVCKGLDLQIDNMEQVTIPKLKIKRDCISQQIEIMELQAQELRQKVPQGGAVVDDIVDVEFDVKD